MAKIILYRQSNTIKLYFLEMANLVILYTCRYIVNDLRQNRGKFRFPGLDNSADENYTLVCLVPQIGDQFFALIASELIVSFYNEPISFPRLFRDFSGGKYHGAGDAVYHQETQDEIWLRSRPTGRV